MPCFTKCFTTLSAPCFVRVKIKIEVASTSFKISTNKAFLFPLSIKYNDCLMISAVEETGVTSTRIGSRSIVPANFRISGAIVAEKNKFCRFSGKARISLLTSWMNPISSMRSASSRTKISTSRIEINPCVIKSNNLPGVATNISTPFFKTPVCLF